ncbi:MAG: acyl-CoA thioesterase [Proteobacteria bacterium]|nr:acyl-CoA thioesterase [Pseudomonadota bacterium]MBU1686454.1 acyl-CoA thioesterase [Pseudomonadota bacterium]
MNCHLPAPIRSVQYRVLYGDTDSGGVVYYGNYLRFFEIGRTEFLRDFGASYRELEERGYIMPVVECSSRYKASARYDDLLTIETSLLEVKKYSCRFNHRILRDNDGQLLVKGFTIHACTDLHGKLSRFPDYFQARLLAVTSGLSPLTQS